VAAIAGEILSQRAAGTPEQSGRRDAGTTRRKGSFWSIRISLGRSRTAWAFAPWSSCISTMPSPRTPIFARPDSPLSWS